VRRAWSASDRSSGPSPWASACATTAAPCFRSHHYQAEIDHLAIARSPAYHYEPETNGCVEKFIQTLKEQVLWIERFETLDQLRAAVREFVRTYNRDWLIERHGYRSPLEAREQLLALMT